MQKHVLKRAKASPKTNVPHSSMRFGFVPAASIGERRRKGDAGQLVGSLWGCCGGEATMMLFAAVLIK